VQEDKRNFYCVLKQQLGLVDAEEAHGTTSPPAAAEQKSLGVRAAPTAREALPSEEERDFVKAIKAYNWALAEELATTAEQKQDLRDSMARVKALELHTNRGEKDKALALAITEAEVRKIHAFAPKNSTSATASTPRGFFGAPEMPQAKQPFFRQAPAVSAA
jgi:hypothetical protein